MIYVSLLSVQCCNELDLCPFSMILESFAKMLVGNGRHNRGPVQSRVQGPGFTVTHYIGLLEYRTSMRLAHPMCSAWPHARRRRRS